MLEEFEKRLEVDKERVRNAVRYQLPIEITTYTLPRNMEIYIREILQLFLVECHQEQMAEYLNFCSGELLTNAKKANTKRVYFKEKGLDINNPEDYQKGMESFKDETITNIGHYLELQKKAGLYIKMVLQLKGEQVLLEIRNNSTLTVFEEERIRNKINGVQQYNSMEEVFTKVLDQSEGAGLGIIIIILMLQKIGLSKENYQVYSEGKETVTRIVLPCNEKVFSGSEILTYEFVKMQEAVPVRESKYLQIREILASPVIDRNKLLATIYDDPTVLLLFLKKTLKKNSGEIEFFRVISQLTDTQIKDMFKPDVVGDESIVNEDVISEQKSIYLVREDLERVRLWKHARNVAQYAYNILNNFPEFQIKTTPEQIYSLALLNSIGTIMLLCTTQPQKKYVMELCQQFEDTEKMIDVFYSGNSCPYISMIYLKKLGLRDDFAAAVGCWNNELYAADSVITNANILYVAEVLQLYDEDIADFYQFNSTILEKFKIKNEAQFKDLLAKLKAVVEK